MDIGGLAQWTLTLIGLTTSLAALIAATIAAKRAALNARELATTDAAALTKRIASLEAVQIELAEDIKRVRSRYVMRERRANGADGGEPDWRTDPDGWRAYQDKQIARRQFALRGKP